jgi:hypothetical protein
VESRRRREARGAPLRRPLPPRRAAAGRTVPAQVPTPGSASAQPRRGRPAKRGASAGAPGPAPARTDWPALTSSRSFLTSRIACLTNSWHVAHLMYFTSPRTAGGRSFFGGAPMPPNCAAAPVASSSRAHAARSAPGRAASHGPGRAISAFCTKSLAECVRLAPRCDAQRHGVSRPDQESSAASE